MLSYNQDVFLQHLLSKYSTTRQLSVSISSTCNKLQTSSLYPILQLNIKVSVLIPLIPHSFSFWLEKYLRCAYKCISLVISLKSNAFPLQLKKLLLCHSFGYEFLSLGNFNLVFHLDSLCNTLFHLARTKETYQLTIFFSRGLY